MSGSGGVPPPRTPGSGGGFEVRVPLPTLAGSVGKGGARVVKATAFYRV